MSAREHAERLLARIERLDPVINAFCAIDRELVLRDAERVDAIPPSRRGPLHGLGFGVKDLVDVAGLPTRAGSGFWSRMPERDAPVVARLREAGAFCLGKTVTHEWAWGITSENPHTGRVCNPWDLSRIAGGSSGGSGAALAAGFCDLAIGTDTLGSVRIPSAAANATGIRPATGALPMDGIWPLAPSLDVAGPMANRVGIVRDALATMTATPVREAPLPARVARLRGGAWDAVEPHVARALDEACDALRALGVTVDDVGWWDQALIAATTTLQRCEAARVHEPFRDVDPSAYGADVRALLASARTLGPDDAAKAKARIAEARGAFDEAVRGYDALLAPVLGDEPPVAPAPPEFRAGVIPRMAPAAAFALPALALPIGFGPHNVPLGMQIMATRPEPDALLALGVAYEAATAFDALHPPLAEATAPPSP